LGGYPARNLTGRSGNTSFLSGAHQDSRVLSGACQDDQDDQDVQDVQDIRTFRTFRTFRTIRTIRKIKILPGACQEPVRTIRTSRKIKILSGGLQDLGTPTKC